MRRSFIVSSLAIFGYAGAACANSCANVKVLGTLDESGLRVDQDDMIFAVGTFRIADEQDESKQPMFNLTKIDCDKQFDDTGKVSLECKVTQAVVMADSGKPNEDNPNCSLDLDSTTYSMKELQKGVLTGMESFATGCFGTLLTINRNAKRVYLSFMRTQFADKLDKTLSVGCGRLPPTQVLMNCTAWPRIRKQSQGQLPTRFCDFSGANDKIQIPAR